MGLPLEKHTEESKEEKNQLKGQRDGIVIEGRKCTDIFFCLFFLLFICLLIAISIFSFVSGNPNRLLIKFDSDGNICGQDNQN